MKVLVPISADDLFEFALAAVNNMRLRTRSLNKQLNEPLAKPLSFGFLVFEAHGIISGHFHRSDRMRLLAGAICVVCLAGCVSPGDLESKAPSISAHTSKDPKRYALCVFPQWQEARTDVSMSETDDGYRLVAASNMLTDELLNIRMAPGGSAVALYQRSAWAPGYGRNDIELAVKDCL